MRYAAVAGIVCLGAILSGCGQNEDADLQSWLTVQRNATQPKVTPIAEPKEFKPQAYAETNAVEPFNKERLTQALRSDTTQVTSNAALVAPELSRPKEVLEAYPLDSMTLVGNIMREGRPLALVRVNNLLYQVRPGEYLGQNYGRVMKISETEVALREIVQDAGGEWIERMASLQLQEGSK